MRAARVARAGRDDRDPRDEHDPRDTRNAGAGAVSAIGASDDPTIGGEIDRGVTLRQRRDIPSTFRTPPRRRPQVIATIGELAQPGSLPPATPGQAIAQPHYRDD